MNYNLYFNVFYHSLRIACIGNQKTYQRLYQHYISYPPTSDLIAVSKADKVYLHQLTEALKTTQNYALWRPKCYNLALVTIHFLLNKKVPHQLYIGFRTVSSQIEGHAWVKVGGIYVCGERSDIFTYQQLKV